MAKARPKEYEEINPLCFECSLNDCWWSGPAESCPYARGEKEAPPSLLEGEPRIRESIITDRPGNPYRPGSKLWRLYQEDFPGCSVCEIAEQLGSTVNSVRNLINKVYKDTGYMVPRSRQRTMVWVLRNEDFSNLTVPEIAELFRTSENAVRYTMAEIFQKTGYRVPYVHLRQAKEKE